MTPRAHQLGVDVGGVADRAPIERAVSLALARSIARERVVEVGRRRSSR